MRGKQTHATFRCPRNSARNGVCILFGISASCELERTHPYRTAYRHHFHQSIHLQICEGYQSIASFSASFTASCGVRTCLIGARIFQVPSPMIGISNCAA